MDDVTIQYCLVIKNYAITLYGEPRVDTKHTHSHPYEVLYR